MQNEIWKDIPGYAGLYQISNAGRIRSYSKMRGPVLLRPKNLQSRVNKHGYLQKTLVNENGRKTWDIHRLVALTFIPNPENKPCVDHINTNRTDNRVENLRWVTYSENASNPITNAKQRKRIGPMAGKYGELHHGSKSVSQFTKTGRLSVRLVVLQKPNGKQAFPIFGVAFPANKSLRAVLYGNTTNNRIFAYQQIYHYTNRVAL